jgi:DNA-binding LacI/PurR family transcriptional regulator
VEQDDSAPTVPAARRRARPLLADVAAHVGLSTATVSLVLSGAPGPSAQTRQRVEEAAAALGYRPDRTASALARRRSGLLGVLLDVRSAYHGELVEHLDAAAAAAGYDLVLSSLTSVRDEARATDTLLDFRCEALVLLGPEAPPERLGALARAVPTVVLGRRVSPLVADVVRTSDSAGMRAAVDHLVDLGHRDVALVDGGRGTIPADRRRGYRTAMRRHGLANEVHVLPGDHTEESGVRAAAALLEGAALPTAVVASNDRCALGLLDALTRAGVPVPDEVSVVGYDDSPQSRWAHLELTTVSQEARQQADRAVAAVVERIAGRSEPREVVLDPRLVVRATTGPPPAHAEWRPRGRLQVEDQPGSQRA